MVWNRTEMVTDGAMYGRFRRCKDAVLRYGVGVEGLCDFHDRSHAHAALHTFGAPGMVKSDC